MGGFRGRVHHAGGPRRGDGAGHQHRRGLAGRRERQRRRRATRTASASDVGAEKAEKFTTAFIESIAKQRKRNVEWAAKAVREAEAITQDEALELSVIDLVAADTDELLREARGAQGGGRRREARARARGRRAAPDRDDRCSTRLSTSLADPNIAFLLVMAGLLGLYVEFNSRA